MKKFLSIFLILFLLVSGLPAAAVSEGQERVVIGNDLTQEQVAAVYSQFGITRGSIPELTVSNAEERDYLEGLVDESIIGHNSISCVYIRIMAAGSGLDVSANNISWCTEDMYKAALMTAGIYDARVKIGAPFSVSGTAALTGIYKAYENITGAQLQQQAKSAATDELVTTAQLAEQIDNTDAVAIVNDLKLILDQTQTMSDDQLRTQVDEIADEYGYDLNNDTVSSLMNLCRTLEGVSTSQLQEKVQEFQSKLSSVSGYAQKLAGVGSKIASFFQQIIDFIAGLFVKD